MTWSNSKKPVCQKCKAPSRWTTDTQHGYLCDGCRYRMGLLTYFSYITSQLSESEDSPIGKAWREQKERERKARFRQFLDRFRKDPEHQERKALARQLQRLS